MTAESGETRFQHETSTVCTERNDQAEEIDLKVVTSIATSTLKQGGQHVEKSREFACS